MYITRPCGPPWPRYSNLVVQPQRGPLAPFGFPGGPIMTNETNGTAPELIVLGRDEIGKPRAARFPAGHDNLVAKAAKAMNLTVCKADGEALAELAKKLQTGPLVRDGSCICAASRPKPLRPAR